GPEIVRVADHRGPRGTPDRGLHLLLDGGEGPLDDLQHDRVHAHRVTTRLPSGSTRAVKPGCSGTVEPYSSMTAGPATTSPGPRSARWSTCASTYPSSKYTGRTPGRAGPVPTMGRSEGRRIGPIPVTRRLTHSTCCSGRSRKQYPYSRSCASWKA